MYEKENLENQKSGRSQAAGLVRQPDSRKEKGGCHRTVHRIRGSQFLYDIGREDARQEVIEIAPLDIPDFVPADTLSDEKVRDMEEFFNQFNNQGNE